MSEFSLGDLFRTPVSNLDTQEHIEYINIKQIEPDPRNFYKLSNLDELVQNIELLGLQQPLRVRTHPEKPDRVIVVSGHRRRAALLQLVKEGHERFASVPCIREADAGSPAMQELRLIFANSATRTLTSGETARQVERTQLLLYELKNEGVEFPGKMRDYVAQACHISASKVARINAIKANLIPEYYEQYRKDTLQESAAYTMSRFPADFQRRLLKAAPKIVSGTYLEGVLKRYESGWRWEPDQTCPDGSACKRGDVFLRHDAECGEWQHCGGKKCCMTCSSFATIYSACERACSKAKAAKKAKNEEKQMAEERERKKKESETWKKVRVWAARLAAAADVARLDDDVKFKGYSYGDSLTIGRLRKIAAGEFEGERVYTWERGLDPVGMSNVPEIARIFQCSADYILGLTDELHPAPEPTGQLVLSGWMPGGTTPFSPTDAVVVFDLNGRHIKRICRWNGWEFVFDNGAKIEMKPIEWIVLPPDEISDCVSDKNDKEEHG